MSAAYVTLSEVVMGIYTDSAIGTHVTAIQKQNSNVIFNNFPSNAKKKIWKEKILLKGHECVSASVPVLHSLGEMSLKVYSHHLCYVSLL